MGKAKGGAILIRLVSAAKTGFFYVTKKNPKKLPNKLAFRKYDPVVSARACVKRGDLEVGFPSRNFGSRILQPFGDKFLGRIRDDFG